MIRSFGSKGDNGSNESVEVQELSSSSVCKSFFDVCPKYFKIAIS